MNTRGFRGYKRTSLALGPAFLPALQQGVGKGTCISCSDTLMWLTYYEHCLGRSRVSWAFTLFFRFRGLEPSSAILSLPRTLVFVAGAFSPSSVPAHGSDRKDRHRSTDHPDQDASGAVTGPPQHTQAHEQRNRDKHHDGQEYGGCEL